MAARRRRSDRRTDPSSLPLDRTALDGAGWTAVAGVLDPDGARRLADLCQMSLSRLGQDLRVGDKPSAGTSHLVDVVDRMPEVTQVFDHPGVRAAVCHWLGEAAQLAAINFRCPRPGFGEQKLHADDLPLTSADGPWRTVTAILALCDFTTDNGATGVVSGSHRRPDLQRHSGSLGRHPDEILLTGSAGTAFVFCGHLLHRGTRNRTALPRPALQASWRLPSVP